MSVSKNNYIKKFNNYSINQQTTKLLKKFNPKTFKSYNLLKGSSIISLKDFKKIKKSLSIFNESLSPKKNIPNLITENSRALIKRIKSYDEIKLKKNYNNILHTENINNKNILEKAKTILEENYKEVKDMNRLVLYAKVANIRDKQIEEHKMIKSLEKKRNEKLDLLCEIARLKDIKRRETEEQKRINMNKEGGRIIRDQILYNEKKKQLEKDMLKKEYEENLKYQKKIDEENEKKLLKSKELGEKLIKDILASNKMFIENKKLKKLKEIEEDKKILEYNKLKAKEEKEKILNLKKEQRIKDLELIKMKEKQEKDQDSKSLLDKIILRRAYESSERAERIKEKENLLKKKKMLDDLIEQNRKMIEYKEIEKMEMAKQEKKDFYTITNRIEREIELEKIKKEKYRNILVKHNFELLKLIKEKEDEKKLKKREILEEGRIIKQNNEKFNNMLEHIKRKKIKELESLKINPLYLVPLKNFRSFSKDDIM